MKSQFKFSGKLMAAALLAGVLALPVVAISQSPVTTPIAPVASNASLDDTLNWLKSFLPTATGSQSLAGVNSTSSIVASNGCNLTTQKTMSSQGVASSYFSTFSLSDIDPSTVTITQWGDFWVTVYTRGGAGQIKLTHPGGPDYQIDRAVIGDFADQATALRVANAFQHAAQVCANAAPF